MENGPPSKEAPGGTNSLKVSAENDFGTFERVVNPPSYTRRRHNVPIGDPFTVTSQL